MTRSREQEHYILTAFNFAMSSYQTGKGKPSINLLPNIFLKRREFKTILKLTKKSEKELLNRHLGNGIIFIHTFDNEFESVNFFLGSKGEFYTEAACLKLADYFRQLAKELMQRIEMDESI